MAVAIGADADIAALSAFTSENAPEPVTAANPEQLVMGLRWASTQVSRASSTLTPFTATPAHLTSAFEPASLQEAVW